MTPARGVLAVMPFRAIVAGIVAAAALPLALFALTSLAQGSAHAADQLGSQLPVVALLGAGLGIQVALLVALRAARSGGGRQLAGATLGTGAGSAAMLACCAHHLVDVLPIIGLAWAATLLGAYQTEILVLSLTINAAVIVWMARQLGQVRRSTAAVCARP